ncbi:MAG: PEP-CTERM sorting domain-containing protein [Planctomycetia bacterium]|nr:PEP-CTERM sorting domain-containing protein [Planctomycetia bacterium]
MSMGIGNQTSGSPDYTFNANAGSYSVRSLQMFVLPTAGVSDTYVWKNDSGSWTDTTWLAGDLETPQATAPGSTNDAYVIGGAVSVTSAATIQNLTISGTGVVQVTGNSEGTGASNFVVSGTLDIQDNATLRFVAGTKYNVIQAATTLTGAGTIINQGGETAINSNNANGYTGTIRIQGGQVWICGSTLANASISLEGGELRNNGNNSPAPDVEIASNITINSTTGGIRPGWEKRTLTLSGVISDGTSNTLKIISDSNDSNWVVLTNENNSFTNVSIQSGNGRLRVTSVGALGDLSGTITNNGTLDLYGSSNGTSSSSCKVITGTGTITNNKSNSTATAYVNVDDNVGTFRDSYNFNTRETVENSKLAVNIFASDAATIRYLSTSNNFSGGLTIGNCVIGSAYGSAFGDAEATITLLNNGTLFNSTYSTEVMNDVVLAGTSTSVRSGWRSNNAVLHVSGDISGSGMMNFHCGESTPSVLMFSGNNTYTGGTKFNSTNHYNLIVNTNSAFGTGTFNTTDANTTIDFSTGGTWGYASFSSSSQSDWGIAGFNYSLEEGQRTAAEGGYAGYTTEVTAEQSGTLTFTRPNTSANIHITNLTDGTRTTLFSDTTSLNADFAFAEGTNYRIDVRYANSELTGNFSVSEGSGGAQPLTIGQDGSWQGISTITSVAKDWTISTPFNIGTRTLTLTNTGVGTATFSGTVDGTGTVVFNGSRNGAMGTGTMLFDGSPLAADDTFNVSVATNTRFSGNGTVGGNLTLADDTALVLTHNSGDLTLNGNLVLSGDTEFVIDLTNIDSDTNWGTLLGTASGLTSENMSFTFTGDASSIDSIVNLMIFDQDFSSQITTEELATLIDFSDVADMVKVFAYSTDNGLNFMVGTHAAVPEPATWVLILLSIPAFILFRRKKG